MLQEQFLAEKIIRLLHQCNGWNAEPQGIIFISQQKLCEELPAKHLSSQYAALQPLQLYKVLADMIDFAGFIC